VRSQAQPDPPSLTTQTATRPQTLRTLTTLREAHTLSAAEARRGYPIHVRAIVTYYYFFPESHRSDLFLHDATGSIYATIPIGSAPPGSALLPGALVDVTGVSSAGDFAPILDQAHVTVVGISHLPVRAKPVTFPDLLSGAFDSEWVQIAGVIHSVIESPDKVTLHIAIDGGTIAATTPRRPGVDYQSLVDQWSTIRGDAGSTFNSNRQLTGARLFFPGLETVFAVAPDSSNAFARPVRPISGLLRFDPRGSWPHRVHVHGAVTLFWPGRTLCIRDATGGLCAQITQTTPLAIGSPIDLAGFTVLAGFKPALSDATYRLSSGNSATAAPPVAPVDALQGTYDSELVQIEGSLIGRDLAEGDTTLILSSGKLVFRAVLPAGFSVSAIPIGSILRITGICSVQVDTQETLKGFGFTQGSQFSILLPSAQGIVVLKTPSWWNANRIGLALLFLLLITIAGFVWAFVLRRRVEQQTRELRESRELYRHMAHHDPLTGLATRTLMHDRLQNAIERARRFQKTSAILMVDLDRFKQINDYFGHSAGDQVLQAIAERIRATIRKTDSVARMGGDEFIILLNDLADGEQAESIAAKIVAALSAPVQIGKFQVPVSVSVGVCTLDNTDDDAVSAEILLNHVDAAMYRAKASGRACFQVFTDDMSGDPSNHLAGARPIEAPRPSVAAASR